MNKPKILYTIIHPPVSRPGYHLAYQKAIEMAGGIFQVLSPDATLEEIEFAIKNADGFLIPGGPDIGPALYGDEKKDYTQETDGQRDSFEERVIKYAIDNNVPLFGICRGAQIINVTLGGTLYQDIKTEKENSIEHDGHNQPRSNVLHTIDIKKDSLLSKIVGAEEVGVNSLHHQGINKLGNYLVATAIAPDGLIEAVELSDLKFFLGVQWHPEELLSDERWKNVFLSFVQSC